MYAVWRWSETKKPVYCDKVLAFLEGGPLVKNKVYGVVYLLWGDVLTFSTEDLDDA